MNKRFLSLKAKIMLSTLIPVVICLFLVSLIIFIPLSDSMRKTAHAEFLQISGKYASSFESKIDDAMHYLSIVASDLEAQISMGNADRRATQKTIMRIFDTYGLLDGSSVYFEENMFDGLDAEYKGTDYGTEKSGKICWYFYVDEGKTSYLPEGISDEIEFEMPHYTLAKEQNRPIYTDPVVHMIEGRHIPMFTLTHPINNEAGEFIGAVTVDLFLNDIYSQLQNEKIYDTGYVVISNSDGVIIYSPRYEDIGITHEQAGISFELSPGHERDDFFNSTSILTGEDTLVTVDEIYISQLDSSFYVSVSAPLSEIDADVARATGLLAASNITAVLAIVLLLFYLIGKLSSPMSDITLSVDKIARGEYSTRILGDYKGEFAVLKNSVNTMADSIESYIGESEGSLNILKNILNGLDAVIYVTKPETGEILFVNDYMKQRFNIEGSGVGQVCYKVLQANMDHPCDFCPCFELDKKPSSTVVWEQYSEITGRDYRKTDRYIEWIGGVKAHLQHAVDITDIKQAQLALDRRLAQQALMTSITQSFLSDGDTKTLITNALRQTGEFMDVSQILYYELDTDGATLLCTTEWIDPELGIDTRIGSKMPIRDPILSTIKTMTAESGFYFCSNDPGMKAAMAPYRQSFQNFIGVPVYLHGEVFGAVDFSRGDGYGDWSESDINLAMLVCGLLIGILERRDMETQLRRLSSIVESSSQLILYVAADSRIDYINPAAASITGYSESEILAGGLDLIFDEQSTRDIREKYIPETLANGAGTSELILTRRDGSSRILAFSSFSIGHDSADIAAIASDVTEIRELEAELIAAKELAEQGSRAKGEFLSRMSHEMRTPMNAIIGMTGIARSSLDPEQKEYCLERIDNASRHLLGVINDILDMSKIESGKFELSFSDFSFERMLRMVLNVISFRLEEKHQQLSLDIDPAIPPLLIGDEQRLAQVITNLLSNSVKFTPEQGRVGVSARVLSEQSGTLTLQVDVYDSGIGISKEQQAKLFRSFEQADGSIARKYGGTGLGLAISKRIIELMDGEVWVDSEEGEGSRFSFTFNVKHSENTALQPEGGELADGQSFVAPGSLKGKTALLAEDVDINREIVMTVLADSGLTIDCAEDGRQAVQMFADAPEKYDIVFMDVHMPDVDGLEATRRIRALDTVYSQSVPIVAMTANVFKEDVRRCLDAGMNGHIGKPIDFDELFEILHRYLG